MHTLLKKAQHAAVEEAQDQLQFQASAERPHQPKSVKLSGLCHPALARQQQARYSLRWDRYPCEGFSSCLFSFGTLTYLANLLSNVHAQADMTLPLLSLWMSVEDVCAANSHKLQPAARSLSSSHKMWLVDTFPTSPHPPAPILKEDPMIYETGSTTDREAAVRMRLRFPSASARSRSDELRYTKQ